MQKGTECLIDASALPPLEDAVQAGPPCPVWQERRGTFSSLIFTVAKAITHWEFILTRVN